MTDTAHSPKASETRHASAVAVDGQGILILGASGSGKSSLALDLIARGAALISDDLVRITTGADGWPMLTHTGRMTGVIEARGIGLLVVPQVPQAPLALAIDMDHVETERLPTSHDIVMLGTRIPCLRRVDSPAFAASLWLLVKGGRLP